MKTGTILAVVFGGLALVALSLGLWLMGSYNGLVGQRETVKNMWSDVETQYQRRVDLIPNLVSTIEGAAGVEKSILQGVVEARSVWAQAKGSGDLNAQVKAATGFDSALSRLLVTVEAYPTLQSVPQFRDLTTNLEGTENRIAVARRDYSGAVRTYNTSIKVFPTNLIAGMFGFTEFQFFEADEGAEKAPKVDFKVDMQVPAAPAEVK